MKNEGNGLDGSNTEEYLLKQYKQLIDFEDAMEKNNYKFVTQYLSRDKRKNPRHEEDRVRFVQDVIVIHTRYLAYKLNAK